MRPLYRLAPAARTPPAAGPGVAFGALLPGTFVERPNRFVVIAEIAGQRVAVASRDPGRLRELLVAGAELRLAPASTPGRRTGYTLMLVRSGRVWASLVPALANDVFAAALAHGAVPGLAGARVIAREVRRGDSRFDFVLDHRGRRLLTEVKSACLVVRGRALFPDAPTRRGTRHLRELIAEQRRGGHALAVFVVQRPDARALAPYGAVDPEFTRALADAARAGVRLLAYACRVSTAGVALERRIPILL